MILHRILVVSTGVVFYGLIDKVGLRLCFFFDEQGAKERAKRFESS
jgi:hypothetical protein